MMANDQEVKYLVPGLERGLQLLLAFGEQHRELTFAELHRLVDMPKATAYRVVQDDRGWRIDDIEYAEGVTLRKILKGE